MLKKGFVVLVFLLSVTTQAHTQVVNICVGKSRKVFQAKKQLSHLYVDGVTSRKSTFWYKGQASLLTLDFYKANVVAKCRTVGSDLYQFKISINGSGQFHQFLGRVNCIACLPAKITRLKDKISKLGQKIIEMKNPKLQLKLREQMYKMTKKLLEQVNEQLENEKTPEEVREQLQELQRLLPDFLEVIAEGAFNSELYHHYLSQL